MQIPLIWRFLETHMTRTPHHSKKKKSAVHGLPLTQAAVGGFFIIWYVHFGRYASFVSDSLLVMVIALSMPFSYTCVAISGKENDTMPATRNLCAKCWTQHLAQSFWVFSTKNQNETRNFKQFKFHLQTAWFSKSEPHCPYLGLKLKYIILNREHQSVKGQETAQVYETYWRGNCFCKLHQVKFKTWNY